MTALRAEIGNGINGNRADCAPQKTPTRNGHMNSAAAGPAAPEFRFNGRCVRAAVRLGHPWFAAADICALLGHRHPEQKLATLPSEEKGTDRLQITRGPQKMSIVNEAGLCTIVANSISPDLHAVGDTGPSPGRARVGRDKQTGARRRRAARCRVERRSRSTRP